MSSDYTNDVKLKKYEITQNGKYDTTKKARNSLYPKDNKLSKNQI